MSTNFDRVMQNLSQLSASDLDRLSEEISRVRQMKTRTYKVTFFIEFAATRSDDMADPDSFGSHVKDAFSYFDLDAPKEQIFDVSVEEQ